MLEEERLFDLADFLVLIVLCLSLLVIRLVLVSVSSGFPSLSVSRRNRRYGEPFHHRHTSVIDLRNNKYRRDFE